MCFPYEWEMKSEVLWLRLIVECVVSAGREYCMCEENRVHEELAVGKGKRRSN